MSIVNYMVIKIIICAFLSIIVYIFILLPILRRISETFNLKKYGIHSIGEIIEISEGVNEDNRKIFGYTIEYKNFSNKIYKLKLKPFSTAKPVLYSKVEIIYNKDNSQIAAILPLDFASQILKLCLFIILLLGANLFILFFEKMSRNPESIWP